MMRWTSGICVLALVELASGCVQGPCTKKACLGGLTVQFVGAAENVTYDVSITAPGNVPVMQCSITRVGSQWTTSCASSRPHSEAGYVVRIEDASLENIVVTVSAGGAMVSEQMFDVVFVADDEFNGPGCGTCTSAGIDVALP